MQSTDPSIAYAKCGLRAKQRSTLGIHADGSQPRYTRQDCNPAVSLDT